MNLSESNNIKIIKTDDINACLEIRRKVFIDEQNVPKELEIDDYDRSNSECEHFLITDNSTNVGTFRLIYDKPEIAHMQRLCVLDRKSVV